MFWQQARRIGGFILTVGGLIGLSGIGTDLQAWGRILSDAFALLQPFGGRLGWLLPTLLGLVLLVGPKVRHRRSGVHRAAPASGDRRLLRALGEGERLRATLPSGTSESNGVNTWTAKVVQVLQELGMDEEAKTFQAAPTDAEQFRAMRSPQYAAGSITFIDPNLVARLERLERILSSSSTG